MKFAGYRGWKERERKKEEKERERGRYFCPL